MHTDHRHPRRNRVCASVLLLLAALTVPGALATTLARLNLEELTQTAAVVARVRCLAQSSRWEDGHLWTLTTFEVNETWKNETSRTLVVRLIGGGDGHRTVQVDGVPRFRVGEEVVLFLEPSGRGELTVISWAQGTFRIHRDSRTGEESVTQDTSGVGVWDPATRKFQTGGVRQMAMKDFRDHVLRAARGAKGSQPQEKQP